jgi:hypothetical protein
MSIYKRLDLKIKNKVFNHLIGLPVMLSLRDKINLLTKPNMTKTPPIMAQS